MDRKGSPSSPQAPNIFVISWELVGKEYVFPAALGRGARFTWFHKKAGFHGPLGMQ